MPSSGLGHVAASSFADSRAAAVLFS